MKIGPEANHELIVLLKGDVKPLKGVLIISEVGVEGANLIGRYIAALPLRLQEFNGSTQGAFPTRQAKALVESGGKFCVLLVAGELAQNLKFFDHLWVHSLAPI